MQGLFFEAKKEVHRCAPCDTELYFL